MLLGKLLDKQRELGMNDRDFAAHLGVPYNTWRTTRRGVRPVRGRVARAAMRAFPDLAPDALSFLLSGDTRIADTNTPVAIAS